MFSNESHISQFLTVIILLISCAGCTLSDNTLQDKVICIDPGHGGTAGIDSFRVGPSGEREEWANLRVALKLKYLLETKTCRVLMTRTTDTLISLQDRARLATKNDADLFISIHHNATADASINFPIIYFHGCASENQASVFLGKCLVKSLRETYYKKQTPASLVSDLTIFPTSGTAVLRLSYGIPGVIGEASFFTNPEEEYKLKQEKYNQAEAQAYFDAISHFFEINNLPVKRGSCQNSIEPFPVFQEAERLNPIALLWKQDYIYGLELINASSADSLEKALFLFTRSVQSFPDSWIAANAHHYRADILEKMKSTVEAEMERKRVREFYVNTQ